MKTHFHRLAFVAVAASIGGLLSGQTTGTSSSSSPTTGNTTSTAAGQTPGAAAAVSRPAVPSATAPAVSTDGTTANAPTTVTQPGTMTPSISSPAADVTRAPDVTGTTRTPGAEVRGTASDPQTSVTGRPDSITTPGAPATSGGAAAPGISAFPDRSGTATHAETTIGGLSASSTAAQLQSIELPQREAALGQLEAQVDLMRRSLTSPPANAGNAPAVADFNRAAILQDVQTRESQLRATIKAAREADAGSWPQERNRLAVDYQAYIDAASRAQAVLGGTLTLPAAE